jgi:50S ribosomal protein L16 3-hydroxylase
MRYQLTFSWPEFISQYWQKKPVCIRQGFKNFQDPITADELAGLALEGLVDSRLVRHKAGKWQVEHGPITEYESRGESNWTLLVQGVDHWAPDSKPLMNCFRPLSDWRLDDLMVSFSVPGGGVGAHLDQYDVFIIQGQGRRHWRVGANENYQLIHAEHGFLQVADFQPIIDVEMLPGDILYIPPGYPHEGYAIEASLNYSVGFRAPSQQEMVNHFADMLLNHDLGTERYRDPKLSTRSDPAEILASEITALREFMLSKIQDDDFFQQWIGQFLSQSLHTVTLTPPEVPYQVTDLSGLLAASVWYPEPSIRWLRVGSQLFVNGMPYNDLPLDFISLLTTQVPLYQDSLQPWLDSDCCRAALLALINAGFLVPSEYDE